MDSETLTDAITADAVTFAETMFFRERTNMETDILEHDGSVVVGSTRKSIGKHDIWRALYECYTTDDAHVIMVTPHQPSARGSILLIEDELQRCPFPDDVWGVEKASSYEIVFSNGSRIKAVHTQDERACDRLRGYKPDLLIVDNWTEEGYAIDEETKASVLIPMLKVDTDLWVNDITVHPTDDLMQCAFEKGAHVKQID